jgi:hypothetical protein
MQSSALPTLTQFTNSMTTFAGSFAVTHKFSMGLAMLNADGGLSSVQQLAWLYAANCMVGNALNENTQRAHLRNV